MADRARAQPDHADDRRRRRRTFLAYDAGAIWAANYSDGTVARIDVKTNDVEATPVGAVQGLAAGEGSAWVSTAGATFADGLPQTCGQLVSGAARPDVLIASDLLLQGPLGAGPRDMADAIRIRARAARLQSRQALARLSLLRRLERADRELRPPHLRGERQRIRARRKGSLP